VRRRTLAWQQPQTVERNDEMKTPTQRQTIIGRMVILLAVGGGAYYALQFLAGLFAPLDAQVWIVTSVAALVILLSATLIASAIKRSKRADRPDGTRAERAALYERTLRTWSALLGESPSLEEPLQSLRADLPALEGRLGLLASPEVLRAYLALRDTQGA